MQKIFTIRLSLEFCWKIILMLVLPGIISACFQTVKAEGCCNTGDLLITISMYSWNSDESFFERKRFIAGTKFLSAKIVIFPISREK